MGQLSMERTEIADLRRLAVEQWRRADRAAALGAMYEARAANGPERLRRSYAKAAEVHRRIGARQLAAARLHEAFATRVERWAGPAQGDPPVLMEAVAETLGIAGAAAALYVTGQTAPVFVAASDPTAHTACHLEWRAAEGPGTTALIQGAPVRATGGELFDRWPTYGPGVASLGIRAVTAVPLQLPTIRLGALCCYENKPGTGQDLLVAAENLAAALGPILLRAAPAESLPL